MNGYQDLPDAQDLPAPPRLRWGWVLLLSCLTCGLFAVIWLLVLAAWARKIRGRSHAYGWAWLYVVFAAVSILAGLLRKPDDWLNGGCFVLYLVVSFLLQGDLEERPIALNLSGFMTFFFSSVYFQYHLQDFGVPGRTHPGEVLNIPDRPSATETNPF